MIQNKKRFLIHLLIVVVVVSIISIVFQESQAKTGSWQVVGTSEFSTGWAEYISMDIDHKDTPYVLFRDSTNGNKATVMQFDGSKWVTFGSAGFSPDKINDTFINFDSSNIPYVVFREQTTDKIIVMKYSGGSWQNLGIVGASSSASWDTSLSFDSKNNPHVVFKDDSNQNRPTVKMFNGTSWVVVGNAGFSNNWVTNTSIDIDSNNTAYAGFSEAAKSWAFTVRKFDGKKWVDVGTAGFSAGQAEANILKLDPTNGTPYVAYRDNANGTGITVKTFDGAKWVGVGAPGFASPMGCCAYDDIGFAIGKNGTPYVAYVDSYEKNKATVMKYDGSSWVQVGSAGFSNIILNISLSIDSNDALYVAFEEDGSFKSTVMKFDQRKELWKEAGNTGSRSGNSEIVSIVKDSNNFKYVAFSDSDESDKATVIKYDGLNSWSRVGSAGFTPDRADWTSLALDSYDKVYIAYSDRYHLDSGGIGKVSVMRYLGGPAGWVNIGNAGFSPEGAEYTKLAIDNLDKPYVAFVDNSSGSIQKHITVMKYDGATWVPVGVPGFSADEAWYPDMVFDRANTPYVVFREQTTGMATVEKFDGRKWVTVGPRGFSRASIDNPKIKFDSKNNLYVAFQDWGQGGKTTVMKFDGKAAWNIVGNAGFSNEESYGVSLSIYNDTPYVSFSYVSAYSGKAKDGTTVMKYDNKTNTWEEVGTNPIYSPTSYTDILVDKLGVPFVVIGGDPVTVMKFE